MTAANPADLGFGAIIDPGSRNDRASRWTTGQRLRARLNLRAVDAQTYWA
jgi:hypothetical protein